jgi:hypothetical protein
MDSFTLAVVIADVIMCAAFVALIVVDKPRKPVATEAAPAKPSGKR